MVINGINAVLDQALEALGYVPKLIHRASSVSVEHSLDPMRCGAAAPQPGLADRKLTLPNLPLYSVPRVDLCMEFEQGP